MKARNRIFRVICLLILLVFLLQGCDSSTYFSSDLQQAEKAYAERNLPLCERLLERYLREEQNSDKRWPAWELLLKAINGNSQEPRASLDCLEAMLEEYENDEPKLAVILSRMANCLRALGQYKRAADCWSAYTDLMELTNKERMEGLRNLASVQFAQKHFSAGEETLQQCLALPMSDHDKILCMLDLAELNLAQERLQEAADLCQQILDSDPDNAVYGMACYLRGDALEQLGKSDAALRQFHLALETYPNPAVIENRIKYITSNLKNKKNK